MTCGESSSELLSLLIYGPSVLNCQVHRGMILTVFHQHTRKKHSEKALCFSCWFVPLWWSESSSWFGLLFLSIFWKLGFQRQFLPVCKHLSKSFQILLGLVWKPFELLCLVNRGKRWSGVREWVLQHKTGAKLRCCGNMFYKPCSGDWFTFDILRIFGDETRCVTKTPQTTKNEREAWALFPKGQIVGKFREVFYCPYIIFSEAWLICIRAPIASASKSRGSFFKLICTCAPTCSGLQRPSASRFFGPRNHCQN